VGTVMLTGIAADAATITVGAEGVGIITDGTEAAVTTSVTGKASLYSPSSPIARTMREWQRCERVAPSRRGRFGRI